MEAIETSREFALASMGADYQTIIAGLIVLVAASTAVVFLRWARRMRPATEAAVTAS